MFCREVESGKISRFWGLPENDKCSLYSQISTSWTGDCRVLMSEAKVRVRFTVVFQF